MSDFDRIASRYIDAWSTTDTTQRRAAVAELYSDDARYVDPLGVATGHDEVSGLIGVVQGQFPGCAFCLLEGWTVTTTSSGPAGSSGGTARTPRSSGSTPW